MKRVLLSFVLLAGILFSLPSGSDAQWMQTNAPDGGVINCFGVSGTNLFAGSSGGVFLSTNSGTSWTAAILTNTSVAALAVSGTNLFAGTFANGDGHGGLVFLSTSSGANWTPASIGLPSNSYVYALAVSGANLFAGTSGGVFLSTNNGTSWTAVNTGLPTGRFLRLAINTSGEIFVAIIGGGVFKSTDNGASWINTGCPLGNGSSSLVINASGHIFVATTSDCVGCPSGVFRSTDDGATWDPINTGSLNNIVFAFLVSGTNLFAGTYGSGVYLSTNNGTSWTETGLTQETVGALAVSGTNLFAGTWSGVWIRPLSEMITVVKSGELLPKSFSLSQNFPNPFNPATVVSYQLPVASNVRLVVHDLIGREVSVLVNERKEPGSYTVQFNASGLASGVYFYRLQAASHTETKKLVVLR